MSQAASLRQESEHLAGALPPLMADAEHLATTVMMGAHGRRRAGMGDEFWQYRPARPGDEARQIDWRRSAQSDVHFVKEKEWQAAQSILLWVDDAQSMDFASEPNLPTKADRARVLALATAILLVRGGERVALSNLGTPPRGGELQLIRIATALLQAGERPEYGVPNVTGMVAQSRALFVSDFMGDFAPFSDRLTKAADLGVKGLILQVLDPQEESFPFDGRTIFESMGRSVSHETLKASDLRDRYLDRLNRRKDQLSTLARRTGWQFDCHHTSQSAQSALLWIYAGLERRR
ncbi:MAG: DUF58 domain-containing protein [Marinosulfonomonas sp.]